MIVLHGDNALKLRFTAVVQTAIEPNREMAWSAGHSHYSVRPQVAAAITGVKKILRPKFLTSAEPAVYLFT